MSKETEIINHLKGLTDEQKAIVGEKGQVQLIKKENGIEIIEFYDTESEATTEANNWKA
tara:strand:- start:335 stop:511 length:177 start_codon:yes stop_codon:yes gene_type:complete